MQLGAIDVTGLRESSSRDTLQSDCSVRNPPGNYGQQSFFHAQSITVGTNGDKRKIG